MLLPLLAALSLTAPWCDIDGLERCVSELPAKTQQQLAAAFAVPKLQLPDTLAKQVQGQGAVALLFADSGMVLTDRQRIEQHHSVIWQHKVVELPSQHSVESALIHEQGHLLRLDTPAHLEAKHWVAGWEQELIADLYLLWRIAREQQGLEPAWRLYQLRNLNVMQLAPDWQHWSVPGLHFWLSQPERLRASATQPFNDFLLETQIDTTLLADFRLLAQRQFQGGSYGQHCSISRETRRHWQAVFAPTASLLSQQLKVAELTN